MAMTFPRSGPVPHRRDTWADGSLRFYLGLFSGETSDTLRASPSAGGGKGNSYFVFLGDHGESAGGVAERLTQQRRKLEGEREPDPLYSATRTPSCAEN
jgi:hypothetical protein